MALNSNSQIAVMQVLSILEKYIWARDSVTWWITVCQMVILKEAKLARLSRLQKLEYIADVWCSSGRAMVLISIKTHSVDALQINTSRTTNRGGLLFSSTPDTLVEFVNELGYPKEVVHLSNVTTNDMFQPLGREGLATPLLNLSHRLMLKQVWGKNSLKSIQHPSLKTKEIGTKYSGEIRKANLSLIISIREPSLGKLHPLPEPVPGKGKGKEKNVGEETRTPSSPQPPNSKGKGRVSGYDSISFRWVRSGTKTKAGLDQSLRFTLDEGPGAGSDPGYTNEGRPGPKPDDHYIDGISTITNSECSRWDQTSEIRMLRSSGPSSQPQTFEHIWMRVHGRAYPDVNKNLKLMVDEQGDT
ncbi:hypothetical protein Tco_1316886 [Tanacetum coccineum]